MNYDNQVWNSTFQKYKDQIAKNFSLNEAKFKQLIKLETTQLLKNVPQGLDKNQLLTNLQEIFGSKNFQNGKYKGGKEVVIETFYEFFGKENFELLI